MHSSKGADNRSQCVYTAAWEGEKKHSTYGPVCAAMRHKREEEIESVGMEGKDRRGEE